MPTRSQPSASSQIDGRPSLDEIYRQLHRGVGHEWVDDGNVKPLIEMAVAKGHRLLEIELREWRSKSYPSAEDAEVLSRPTEPTISNAPRH